MPIYNVTVVNLVVYLTKTSLYEVKLLINVEFDTFPLCEKVGILARTSGLRMQ